MFCTFDVSACVGWLTMTVIKWIVKLEFSAQFCYSSFIAFERFISVHYYYCFVLLFLFLFIAMIRSVIAASWGWTSVLLFCCNNSHCYFLQLMGHAVQLNFFLGGTCWILKLSYYSCLVGLWWSTVLVHVNRILCWWWQMQYFAIRL